MKRNKILFILIVAVLSVVACSKDDHKSSIPEVRVDFACDLAQNPYSAIQIQGQFIKVTRNNNNIPIGFGGLIIGHSLIDFNLFYAFDAACPVEARRNATVEVVNDGVGTAVCPVCSTKYDLGNGGFPKEGKGKERLKSYKVSKSPGQTLLRVHN